MKSIKFKDNRLIYEKYTLSKIKILLYILVNLIAIFLAIIIMTNSSSKKLLTELVDTVGFIVKENPTIKSTAEFSELISLSIFIPLILIIIYLYIALPKLAELLLRFHVKNTILSDIFVYIKKFFGYKGLMTAIFILIYIQFNITSEKDFEIIITLILGLILIFVLLKTFYRNMIFVIIALCYYLPELYYLPKYEYLDFVLKKLPFVLFFSVMFILAFWGMRLIILFDYSYADYIKKTVKEKFKNSNERTIFNLKEQLTYIVLERNQFNFYFSISIFVTIIIFCYGGIRFLKDDIQFNEYSEVFLIVCFGIVLIRFISRSVEIIYSFYNDIIEFKKVTKTTFLDGSNRIILALFSLAELSILAALLNFIHYFYIGDYLENGDASDGLLNGLNIIFSTIHILLLSIMKSFSISFFNFSYPGDIGLVGVSKFILLLVHLIQVIVSVVLITLSIANYLALPKEKIFYSVEKDVNTDFYQVVKYLVAPQFEKRVFIVKGINELDFLERTIESYYECGSINSSEYIAIFEALNDYKEFIECPKQS